MTVHWTWRTKTVRAEAPPRWNPDRVSGAIRAPGPGSQIGVTLSMLPLCPHWIVFSVSVGRTQAKMMPEDRIEESRRLGGRRACNRITRAAWNERSRASMGQPKDVRHIQRPVANVEDITTKADLHKPDAFAPAPFALGGKRHPPIAIREKTKPTNTIFHRRGRGFEISRRMLQKRDHPIRLTCRIRASAHDFPSGRPAFGHCGIFASALHQQSHQDNTCDLGASHGDASPTSTSTSARWS
jgi:hypothetical protein